MGEFDSYIHEVIGLTLFIGPAAVIFFGERDRLRARRQQEALPQPVTEEIWPPPPTLGPPRLNKFMVIAAFYSVAEAQMVCSQIEDAGMVCILLNSSTLAFAPAGHRVQVSVLESDAPQVRALLDSLETEPT